MSDPTDVVNIDPTIDSKVLQINTKTRRGKKNNPADPDAPEPRIKLKFATIERDLCGVLEGVNPPLLSNMPSFPFKFESVRMKPTDNALPLLIENNTAQIVNTEFIAGKLRHYVQNLTDKQADYAIPVKRCIEVVTAWTVMYTHRKELPKAVGFLSDPDLCLHRFGWDPYPVDEAMLNKKAPIFSDYLRRMTNSKAFCMRVGSIFDPHAHRKQTIWLEGVKDSGKSPLGVIICMLVGDSYTVISDEGLNEKFWKEPMLGKRVVIMNEISPRFLRTTNFKNLTGDRVHQVRPFGGRSITAVLEPITICISNDSPGVQNDSATTERVLHCVISVIPIKDRISEARLLENVKPELPFIANYCYGLWKTHPEGLDIPNDPSGEESLKKAVEDYESSYLDFIANYLDLQPENTATKYYAEQVLVQKLMMYADFRSAIDQSICKRVILSQPGVRQSRMTIPSDNRRVNCFLGARIKPDHHTLLRRLMLEI